mgnify:CR=1 FL=1
MRETLGVLSDLPQYANSVSEILSNKWVKPSKRILIIQRFQITLPLFRRFRLQKKLSEAEEKIYDLVVKRFLAVFFPAAEYDVTTRITTVKNEKLKTEGKILVKAGWLAVYGREVEAEATLPAVSEKEQVLVEQSTVEEKATKAPPRYTEATLLSAMERRW